MGANALRGLGLGLAAAGETLGRGMSADIQARRDTEREALREASLERRWSRELAARKEERAADQAFQAEQRKSDKDFQASESQKNREVQSAAEAGRNSRLDKQINLQERYQLTKELSDVQQQVAGRLSMINENAAKRLQTMRETLTGPALAEAEKTLQAEYAQAFEQARSMGEAQQKQVINAYGELGKTVAESASFQAGDIESLKADLGLAPQKKAEPVAEVTAIDGRTVKDPNSATGLFGQGFDVGAATAGRQGLPGVPEFDKRLSTGDYSVAGKVLGRAGVLAGRAVGDLKDLGASTYGGLFWSPSEQEAYKNRSQ